MTPFLSNKKHKSESNILLILTLRAIDKNIRVCTEKQVMSTSLHENLIHVAIILFIVTDKTK